MAVSRSSSAIIGLGSEDMATSESWANVLFMFSLVKPFAQYRPNSVADLDHPRIHGVDPAAGAGIERRADMATRFDRTATALGADDLTRRLRLRRLWRLHGLRCARRGVVLRGLFCRSHAFLTFGV